MSDLVKHILFPTDGSQKAEAAFQQALDLALHHRARLSLLHIAQHGTATAGSAAEVDALRRELAGMLDEFESAAKDAGVKRVQRSTSSGLAYSRILQFAESQDIDLIVLGAVGAGGASGLGDVATHVSKFANCTVLIVR
jgi:nucleotide-binding universal stress UspA family protein